MLPEFDYKPEKYNGISKEKVFDLRKKYLNPALFHYYKEPLMVVEGKMQYVFDENGRRYLDALGGIVTVSVGHCHPYLTEAAIKQLKKIQHTTTIYLNPVISEYAEALANKMPGDLKVVYFVNSGSEANDLALLMARLYTGNYDVLALQNAYHGGNMTAMGLTAHSTWKFNVPHNFGVQHVVNPDPYQGIWGYDDPNAATKYANEVKKAIEYSSTGVPAAFISESIQGVGGTVIYPDGYLDKVYKIVREKGGVCIADEVQAGFARTGSHYWGFESNGVTPDIVTMAKGIGNGAPLAAVVTTPEIAKNLAQKIHFNTYGGNPISCAIGHAVLDVIEREKIQENCVKIGGILMEGFNKLKEKYDIIGDVRGRGLMLGIELVKDRKTKEPASAECAQVFETCRDLGVLIGKGGLYGSILRIKPPMCLNKMDAEFLLEVLDEAFAKI